MSRDDRRWAVARARSLDRASAPRAACWLAGVLAAGVVAGVAARAHAQPAAGDAVALLPLDAERSLEIYGQPVASEIARALGAGNVAVVVVGPKMAVPDRARLIVDGTIALGKASAVTISLRIRNTVDGVVLETLSATAPGLAKIDGAAAELSARILPIVRDKLAALHRAPSDDHGHVIQVRTPASTPPSAPTVASADRPVLFSIVDLRRPIGTGVLLSAFDGAVSEWIRAHHRPIRKLDPGKLDPRIAARSVAAEGSDLAFGFWILDYTADPAPLPMARARVRVQVTDASAVVFDRVVTTDTVVGERNLTVPELAARVAREVLAILRPHVRRSVPSW
jgi:hypothetical protein